jgi:plastocyanin
MSCFALLLAAGCGSARKSASGESGSAAAGTQTSGTQTSGARTSGAKASGSGGIIKVNTTPRYAAPSASSPVRSGVVHVAYRNIAIEPDTLRVKVGSTIQWTNYDSIEHNVTSAGGVARFASGNFGEGGTYRVRVTTPGIIHYRCTIHPVSMNGAIEVVK